MNLICLLKGHQWKNDNHHPVHGYDEIPYKDSYCGRCGKEGAE